jgi:hypothetical protein
MKNKINKKIVFSDKNINANGTSLIGYFIETKYRQLTKLFGYPYVANEKADNKIDWFWQFKLNGTVITIYNWKNGPNYGFKKVTPNLIERWNIGGHYEYDLNILNDYILNRNFKKYTITNDKGQIWK